MLRLVGGHERPRRSGDVGARAADGRAAAAKHVAVDVLADTNVVLGVALVGGGEFPRAVVAVS